MADPIRRPRRIRRMPKAYNYFAASVHLAMGILYIIFGVFLMFVPQGKALLEDPLNYIVGGPFMLYGAFRIYRGWAKWQEKDSYIPYAHNEESPL